MAKATKSLDALLKNHPNLKAKLIEALETEHFFITTSCQLRKKPGDPNDLQHCFHHQNYPPQDIVKTLRHIERDFTSKVCPTAASDDLEGDMH